MQDTIKPITSSIMQRDTVWKKCATETFWGKIAPCDHVVHMYEDKASLLDVLAGFVADGIKSGDSIIVIATREHLNGVEARLWAQGIQVDSLLADDHYIALDAQHTLSHFMINGFPDERLFMSLVKKLMIRARKQNRKVRAFGEMVALLMDKGQIGATVQLEQLWNKFCADESLALLCAYPKSQFKGNAEASFEHICTEHSKLISSSGASMAEIIYKDVAILPTSIQG
jgi:hypothetical protein